MRGRGGGMAWFWCTGFCCTLALELTVYVCSLRFYLILVRIVWLLAECSPLPVACSLIPHLLF